MNLLLLALSAHAGETPLLPRGDVWRYLDDGVDPGPGWELPAYDDTAWPSGPAPLGYGLAPLGTTVSYGPDPADRHPTTWFRTTFTVADPSVYEAFSLALRRDDGAAVYVNGVEVLRDNLAVGATALSYATTGVYGADQDAYLLAVLPSAALQAGDNVVAVEVHNQSANSTDLVMDLGISGWDGPTTVTRGPFLQQPTPSSVLVRWRTDGPGEGELRWGATPQSLTHVRTDGLVGFEHEIRIDGWTADTDLAYAVAHPTAGVLEGADPQHVLHTPPATGAQVPLRFWILGDSGTASADAAAVRDAYYSMAPDPLDTQVWLMLGDNAYGSGTESEYEEAVFAFYPEMLRQVPLWAALGNHDGYSAFSDTQTGPYFDLFSWPAAGESGGVPSGTEAYWSFDHGNVHVVDLDSYHSDRDPGAAMATWLRADLAATNADWLIAMFHHPPYSKGSHDSDRELEMVEMRENLLPILEDAGVDLVLTGHSHSYERSYLIDGAYGASDELLPEQILQDHDGDPAGDGPYTKWPPDLVGHEGTIEIVAGSSGLSSGGPLDHPVMRVSLASLGSLVLDVDGLELTGRFLDDQGAVLDTFALHKGVTTIVDLQGGVLAMEGEVLSYSVLAIEPDGTPVTDYAWDWGDGTNDVGDAPTHAWTSEGRYTVTVTATDSGGGTASDTLTVNIDNGAPVIDDLFASAGAVEGSPVTLTAVASDPGNDPLTYVWEVDGDRYDGDVVNVTFFDDGTHLALLTVTDDAGRIAQDQLAIDVANAPPALTAIDAPGAIEGTPVRITAVASDPGYDPFTVTWDFGGGDVEVGTAITRTFTDSGAIPVTVTLLDDQGASAIAFATIDVANAPPQIDDLSTTGPLEEGAAITFDAVVSDPGIDDALVVTWDFRDGSAREIGEQVVHVFPDQGPWSVRVYVEDGDGGLVSETLELALSNVAPSIRTLFAPSVVDEGVAQVFRVHATDPGVDDVITATWSFGDGTTLVGDEVQHAWQDDGRWLVGLTVTDDEGQGESQLFEVEVNNLAPVFESFPGRVLIEPGARMDYAVVVRDTDDVHLRLAAPGDASLTDDGVVHWKAPEEPGRATPFQIEADDGDGGVTLQTFAMIVAERSASPDDRLDRDDVSACGCRSAGSAGTLLPLLGLLPLLRRQPPSRKRWSRKTPAPPR
ncbi:MAG: PKD domain-containing protein [Myxococcales bacterium]|nr:PKD domain-containing protein [Myxococcales bacterium]